MSVNLAAGNRHRRLERREGKAMDDAVSPAVEGLAGADRPQGPQSQPPAQAASARGPAISGPGLQPRDRRPPKEPRYTQVPNCLLDNLGDYGDAELRVYLAVCRATLGWHRQEARLTLAGLAEATGLSRQGLTPALQSLLSAGLVVREAAAGGSWSYRLAVEEDPVKCPVGGVASSLRSQAACEGGSQAACEGANIGKEIKTPARVSRAPQAASPGGPAGAGKVQAGRQAGPLRELTDAWLRAYREEFGVDYLFQGAKDGAAAARLLRFMSPAQAMALAKKAWRHRGEFWCKQAATLAGFAGAVNQIRQEVKDVNPPTRQGGGNF